MNGIDEEGSALLAIVFNNHTVEDRNNFNDDMQERIGKFMYDNGYRITFAKFYLQADPKTVKCFKCGTAKSKSPQRP